MGRLHTSRLHSHPLFRCLYLSIGIASCNQEASLGLMLTSFVTLLCLVCFDGCVLAQALVLKFPVFVCPEDHMHSFNWTQLPPASFLISVPSASLPVPNVSPQTGQAIWQPASAALWRFHQTRTSNELVIRSRATAGYLSGSHSSGAPVAAVWCFRGGSGVT